MDSPEIYMQRCLELAGLGAGYTAPNPLVGSVLVYEGRIIGEGYHQVYGKAHAEVNCLASVRPEDLAFISLSTMYVSLEPCAHHGKTPPCADLIIEKRIPRVVVGCRDPFPEVDGKGIEKLRAAGVEVILGVLEKECRWLNRRFFTFHTIHRPYILLKWAQSSNGQIGAGAAEGRKGDGMGKENNAPRVLISNEYSNRLVHKWRSEEAAILVGTNTALRDDPALNVRWWTGPNPLRLVIDKGLRLPLTLRIFDGTVPTIVFNTMKQEQGVNLSYYRLEDGGGGAQTADDHRSASLLPRLMAALYELKILSVMVEGGASLLQSFIDEGFWDEARVITNGTLEIARGLPAPVLKTEAASSTTTLLSDTIRTYYRSGLRGEREKGL